MKAGASSLIKSKAFVPSFDGRCDYFRRHYPVADAFVRHHRTHKNIRGTLLGYPYLQDILMDQSPEIRIRKSTQCFHPDTRVLTDRGYVKISQIIPGVMVLTKDSGFQPVKTVFINEADALIRLRADNLDDVLTTENHPFFYFPFNKEKYHHTLKEQVFNEMQMGEANKLKQGYFLAHPLSFAIRTEPYLDIYKYSNGSVVEESQNHFRVRNGQRFLPKKIPMSYEAGMLFGFFLSEGHARLLGTDIGFSFHKNETEYSNLVVRALKNIFKVDARVNICEKDHCTRININDRALHTFFRNMGEGSDTRKPLAEFYNAPDEFLEGLLFGIFCGDGRLKSVAASLHIKSEELRYFAKWILSKFGYIARNTDQSLALDSRSSEFIKRLCRKPFANIYSRSVLLEDCIATRIKTIEPVKYSGKVYNLEVENDHTYVANGYLVHNCGATELLICRTLMRTAGGRNTFYVFPTYVLKNQFVQDRVEKSIAFTPYYKDLVAASETVSESVSLKNIGRGSVAFVGSNTSSAFTSYAADDAVVDEADECDQKNLAMVPERLSACKDPTQMMVGNPTFDDFGIDYEYKKSDRKIWFIKCQACNHWFNPDFFVHVVRDEGEGNFVVLDDSYDPQTRKEIYICCDKCSRKVQRYKQGYWIHQVKSHISGYSISKLFSTNVRLFELVEKFSGAQKNDTWLQRFYNGDLGLPFTAKGSRIDFSMLNDCKRDYTMPDSCANPCAIGTDVGNVLHTVIQDLTTGRIVFIGEVPNFDEWLELRRRYKIVIGCIDAMPDLHYAKKIRDSHPGMFMVFISKVKADIPNPDRRSISVDRTAFLDDCKEQLAMQNIHLPMNADRLEPTEKDGISQFYHMINNSIRVYDEEKETYRWIEGSRPDHYLFALGFLVLARKLLKARTS